MKHDQYTTFKEGEEKVIISRSQYIQLMNDEWLLKCFRIFKVETWDKDKYKMVLDMYNEGSIEEDNKNNTILDDGDA